MQKTYKQVIKPLFFPLFFHSVYFSSLQFSTHFSIKTMSSTACQGLQTCLQPRFPDPNMILLKLSQQNTQEKEEKKSQNEKNTCIVNCEKEFGNGEKLGSWSFIQTLCNTSKNTTNKGTIETEQVYVHPLVKRNSSTLSSKSLEMCTESLGSETGSDISDNSDEFASMLMETDTQQSQNRQRTRKFNRKVVEFPPPLTSIGGTDGVQLVRNDREGGRLILKVVTLPPCNSYFHAERVDGRLRLSLMKEKDTNEEEIDGHEEEYEVVEKRKCNCKDIGDGEEDDDGKDEMKRKNDDGKGVGEFQRMRRCKGGNRKVMTTCWEPYCLLAIS